MAVKLYKPTTNGRRQASAEDFSDITKTKPVKSLVTRLKKHGGRNNTGRITVRHQGGGAKKMYRLVDFKRTKYDVPATVTAIEYDPSRGPRIALLQYEDGQQAYIICPAGLTVGTVIISSRQLIEPSVGNRMPLEYIPVGLFIHNIELQSGKGGQLVRGAGAGAQLQVIEGEYAQVKLPSGEMRLIKKNCMATVGMVGNSDYKLVRKGKAGRMRHTGKRPTVRGKVMNPVDHPHGGGEGRNSIGLKGGPKTPWGKKALGVKTRRPDKWSEKFIVAKRAKNKKKK